MSLQPGKEWTPAALRSAFRTCGLNPGSCDGAVVQAANRLLVLQRLLENSLPNTHLPNEDMPILAPISDWLA